MPVPTSSPAPARRPRPPPPRRARAPAARRSACPARAGSRTPGGAASIRPKTKIAMHGGAHQQRVERVEVDQAVDVERRQARLVLVERRLRGLDVDRVLPARARPQRRHGARQARVAAIGGSREEEVGRVAAASPPRSSARFATRFVPCGKPGKRSNRPTTRNVSSVWLLRPAGEQHLDAIARSRSTGRRPPRRRRAAPRGSAASAAMALGAEPSTKNESESAATRSKPAGSIAARSSGPGCTGRSAPSSRA